MIFNIKTQDTKPDKIERRSLKQRLKKWISGPTLARDICLVLVIKLIFIFILKYSFFNHPQTHGKHMSLPPEVVAHALFSMPAHLSSKENLND